MGAAGRYVPLFVLGRGGMGTVEAAFMSGKVVAVKRLLPEYAKEKRNVDLFVREVKLHSQLSHPNIVSVYDFLDDGEGLAFVMDYVDGETLAAVIEKGKLEPELAAYVVAAVCDGLHAAHELGLVHRDVSPSNVMISYDGEIKILDFGIAKIEKGAALTKTGEVRGKTAYMSPEQAMSDTLDRRSDLYGVGAILYEAVTGKRMWSGETDLEILRQLALESPPTLEGPLADLHARLVAKDREKRPPTALAVAEELRLLSKDDMKPVLRERMHAMFVDAAKDKRKRIEEAIKQTRQRRSYTLPIAGAVVIVGVAAALAFRNKPEEARAIPPPEMTSAPTVLATSAVVSVPMPSASAPAPRVMSSSRPVPSQRPDASKPLDVDPHPI